MLINANNSEASNLIYENTTYTNEIYTNTTNTMLSIDSTVQVTRPSKSKKQNGKVNYTVRYSGSPSDLSFSYSPSSYSISKTIIENGIMKVTATIPYTALKATDSVQTISNSLKVYNKRTKIQKSLTYSMKIAGLKMNFNSLNVVLRVGDNKTYTGTKLLTINRATNYEKDYNYIKSNTLIHRDGDAVNFTSFKLTQANQSQINYTYGIEAVKTGKSQIYMISPNGYQKLLANVTVQAQKIKLGLSNAQITEGDTLTIGITSGVQEGTTWTTSNKNVITFVQADKNKAVIKAVGAGRANVTITSADKTATATCSVVVVKKDGLEPDENNNIPKKYKIKNKKYLCGIKTGNKLKNIKTDFNKEIKVNDRNKHEISEETVIGTGMEIQVSNENYAIVVQGDLSGDGEVDIHDLGMLKRYLIGKLNLDETSLLSADIDESGEIDSIDMIYIILNIIGEISL